MSDLTIQSILDSHEAIVSGLNREIERLKQEISRLRELNTAVEHELGRMALLNIKSNFDRISHRER